MLKASKSFANWQAKYKTMSFTCCNFSLFLKTLLCVWLIKKYAFNNRELLRIEKIYTIGCILFTFVGKITSLRPHGRMLLWWLKRYQDELSFLWRRNRARKGITFRREKESPKNKHLFAWRNPHSLFLFPPDASLHFTSGVKDPLEWGRMEGIKGD